MPKIRPACDARYSDLRPDSGIVRTTTWGTGGISRLSSSLKLVKPSRARVISLLHAARRGQRGERSFLRWSPDFAVPFIHASGGPLGANRARRDSENDVNDPSATSARNFCCDGQRRSCNGVVTCGAKIHEATRVQSPGALSPAP